MKKLNKIIFVLLFFIGIISICSFDFRTINDDKDIEKLARLMEGSYSSEMQSLYDTNYYDIRLHMKRIWKERTDAIWLYVEQAVSHKQDVPYRQRVYKLSELGNDVFESAVYTFEEPLKYAGDWKKDNPLSNLSPEILTQKEGCSVYLFKTRDDVFGGRTKDKACPSELRGAKYASSIVIITKQGLYSWDRGFDENGKQVWGAEAGGYVFIRTN